MTNKKLACPFLILMLILSITIVSVDSEAPPPKLSIDPQKYTATILGEIFMININVSNVQDLAGFEFKLGYNTTLLDALNASVGSLPKPPISQIIEIHEPEGYVWVAVLCGPTDGNGTLAMVTFRVTYAESASCILNLYDTILINSGAEPIPHEVEDGNYEFAVLNITVTTDKPTYNQGETVRIQGNLTLDDSPHQGLVALEVDDPDSYAIVRRTLQIDPTPPPGEITIVDVIPCNMWGEPKQNFSRGTQAYFKVTVRNNSTEWKKVAVTANAYDGNTVPLGAPADCTTIGPDISTFIMCIYIPSWAYIGTGTVYASVFTDTPRNGGVPYCPEKSANFTITGSGGSSLETQDSGNYTLTFRLAPNARAGIYQVYASVRYLKRYIVNSTVFGVNVICVPNDYPTIQEAINAANSTHYTILVLPNVYNENISINKTVTLVARDPNNTIINGSKAGTVITVNANKVEVRRFIIQNSGSAFPYSGITLNNSSNSTIAENMISGNYNGIYLNYSSQNIVRGNTVTSNNGYGIYLNHSTSITLKNNILGSNKYNFGVSGDSVSHFTHDIDTSNTIDGKPIIYWINKQNTVVPFNAGFVAIVSSTNIILRALALTRNSQGVLFAFTNDSLIERVNIISNEYGIYMIHSHRNTIVGSTISNNSVGLHQTYSNENIICHNNFINNTNQLIRYQSSNTWNDTAGKGNYWSDYMGVDDGSNNRTAGDGVGDTLLPHQGVDWHPLIHPWMLISDVAVKTVTVISEIYPGWVINVTVGVRNEGDFTQSFSVTAYYNGNIIETGTVTDLTPQKETIINLTWNTANLPLGTYTIKANATLFGDINPTNNEIVDGTVKVRLFGDVNDDGKITIADVKIVILAYSGIIEEPYADLNGDGIINIADVKLMHLIYSSWSS